MRPRPEDSAGFTAQRSVLPQYFSVAIQKDQGGYCLSYRCCAVRSGIECRTSLHSWMGIVMSNYPSDVNDQQWEAVRRCIPPSRPVGVTRQVSLRDVVDGIRYRERSGCPWRLLPHDFPHWRTVYGYARQWRADGTWQQIEKALRDLRVEVSSNEAVPRSPAIQTVSAVDAVTTAF